MTAQNEKNINIITNSNVDPVTTDDKIVDHVKINTDEITLETKEISDQDCVFMKRAIELAKKAAEIGEVPIGAVIVKNGEIISEGYNLRETAKLATAHAEISAIDAACKKLGGWRLFGCTLYVTLEPCAMCAGAIVNSRIDRVVYGASDIRFGACGSLFNINSYPLNHAFEVTKGICEVECKSLLSSFFSELRKKR